jgi:hypothetical protein
MTIGQFTAMKNKLVFWAKEFPINITKWLQTNHPLFMQEWDYSVERSKECLYRAGFNSYKYGRVVCLIDRMGEDEFTFNTNTPLIKWVPFQEYPKRSFANCMFETAQNIADTGKTIDFFWSGGLDSNAALLAFNELGLEKQLHVIMGGKLESPDLFEKIVKGRMNYTWDETSSKNVLFSIAQPDKHISCSGSEADPQFGAKGTPDTEGNSLENSFGCWENKRRYYSSHNTWGMAVNYSGDWVDINNYMPFYMHESIEKWLCNHVIAGDMVYYHLENNDDWGNDWLKTGESLITSSGQQHYKKCKMPLRNFIYDITKDKNLSYEMGKNLSTIRCPKEKPYNVLAITGEGNIINKNNFNDYDWSSYITNL